MSEERGAASRSSKRDTKESHHSDSSTEEAAAVVIGGGLALAGVGERSALFLCAYSKEFGVLCGAAERERECVGVLE